MVSALTCTVHAIGVTAGLLLGGAPEQVAAVLAGIALGTHALLRRHLPAATPQRTASAPRRRAASAR